MTLPRTTADPSPNAPSAEQRGRGLTRCVPALDLLAIGLILFVAVGIRLAFFPNAPVFFEGDARGYFVRAVAIASGDGFNFTLKRTPGYSLFMALVFWLVGPSLDAVVVAQHLLGVGTALTAYGLGRVIAGPAAGPMVGLIAGLATAASGSSLIYEHAILTESLFTFILTVGTLMLAIALRRRTPGWLAVAGLVAGLGSLARPVGLAVPAVVPPLAILLHGWRHGLVAASWYVATFALALAPWVVHNAAVHGDAAPAHPGRFLISRTVRHNPTGVSMYADADVPDAPRPIRAGRRIMREIEPEQPTSFEIHGALVRRLRLSDSEASDLMWELAVDAIRRHPNLYLLGTWSQLMQVVVGRDESVAVHVQARRSSWKGQDLERMLEEGKIPPLLPEVWPEVPERPHVAETVARLYQPSAWMVLILAGGGLATLWSARDRSRRLVLLPLGVTAALVLCTVAVGGGLVRYRYPVDPLLHVGAAAGLVWTLRALARLARNALGRTTVESAASRRPISAV